MALFSSFLSRLQTHKSPPTPFPHAQDELSDLSARLAERWEALEKERDAEREAMALRHEALQQRIDDAESARAFAEALLEAFNKAREAEMMASSRGKHTMHTQDGDVEGSAEAEEMDAAVREQVRGLVREAHEAHRAKKELGAALDRSRASNEQQRQELTAEMNRLSKQLLKAGHREVALQNTLAEARAKLLAEQAAFSAYKEQIVALDAQAKARRARSASAAPTFSYTQEASSVSAEPQVDLTPAAKAPHAVGLPAEARPREGWGQLPDPPDIYPEEPASPYSRGRRMSIDDAVDDARKRRSSLDAALAEAASLASPSVSPQRSREAWGVHRLARPPRLDVASTAGATAATAYGGSGSDAGHSPQRAHAAARGMPRSVSTGRLGSSLRHPPLSPAAFAMGRVQHAEPQQQQPVGSAALRTVLAASPTPSLSDAVHASHGARARQNLTALAQKLDKSIERASTPLPQSPVPSSAGQPTASAIPSRIFGGQSGSSSPLNWQAASPALLRRLSANPSPVPSTAGSVQLAPRDKLDLHAASNGHRETMDFFSRINSQLDRSLSKTRQGMASPHAPELNADELEHFGFD